MEPTTDRRPRIVSARLDEGAALPVVVVLDAFGDPLAVYREHARAALLLDLLGVVGSRDFVYPGPEGSGDPEVDAVRVERILADGSGSPESRLETVDRILGGFGVEEVGPVVPEGRTLAYVNAGDTYAATVGHDGEAFRVGSWGDFVEGEESERAEQALDDGEPDPSDLDDWADLLDACADGLLGGPPADPDAVLAGVRGDLLALADEVRAADDSGRLDRVVATLRALARTLGESC